MNQPKLTQKSFERAVFDGDIGCPPWTISTPNLDSLQYKPALVDRAVRRSETGQAIGYVLDLQDRAVVEWAETKPMKVIEPDVGGSWIMHRISLAEQFPEAFPLGLMHTWGK